MYVLLLVIEDFGFVIFLSFHLLSVVFMPCGTSVMVLPNLKIFLTVVAVRYLHMIHRSRILEIFGLTC